MLPVTDLADYQALFEGLRTKGHRRGLSLLPLQPEGPTLIKRSIPDARLIAILRNPADRAYSNFLHCVRGGRSRSSTSPKPYGWRKSASS